MKNILNFQKKTKTAPASNHQFFRLIPIFLLIFQFAVPGSGSADDQPDKIAEAHGIELVARIDHLDTLCREPMIAVHPDGTLFVAGYSSQVTGTDWTMPPPLWRSEDNGETWVSVDVGSSEDGAQGNSDVDLAVAPDGTVYFMAMGFNRTIGAGTHIAMGVSHDDGSNWIWQRLSTTRYDDRPWIRIAADGSAHAIWNDGKGVVHQISHDAGRSWAAQPRIHPSGGSSHMAIGSEGKIAVRISAISASANQFDADADSIAVSLDNGKTWKNHAIPGNVEWDPTFSDPTKIPRWVEPLAWGPDNTLYHLWSEGTTVHLGWSVDYGENWQSQVIATEPGSAFFPYMMAGADGRLAATWFIQDGTSLTARVALIIPGAASALPEVVLAAPFTPLAWNEDKGKKIPTPAGEYIPVVFLPGGDLAVVSPIQDIHNDRWGFTFWRFRTQ